MALKILHNKKSEGRQKNVGVTDLSAKERGSEGAGGGEVKQERKVVSEE